MPDATEPSDVRDDAGPSEPSVPLDPSEPVEAVEPPELASVAQERARDGIEHLQTAAHELIAAARAALDVAEDIIDDPDTISSVVGAAGHLGGVGDLLRSLLPTRRDAGGGRGGADAGSGADGSSTIQRIKIV